jgi:hypothetical protein
VYKYKYNGGHGEGGHRCVPISKEKKKTEAGRIEKK